MTLCLSSLWMAQCNITYIVVFNLYRKKKEFDSLPLTFKVNFFQKIMESDGSP